MTSDASKTDKPTDTGTLASAGENPRADVPANQARVRPADKVHPAGAAEVASKAAPAEGPRPAIKAGKPNLAKGSVPVGKADPAATPTKRQQPIGTVVTLSDPQKTSHTRTTAQKRRRRKLWLSFFLCVLLPIALVSYYYGFVATDRYAARVGFSIRGVDSSSGIDGIAAVTGLASIGSTTSDSYIVLDYLESRALLEAIDQQVDLRAAYSAKDIDLLSRLASDATIEEFVDYWQRHIHTQFDPTSGIIEFEVQSFSPEHARATAEVALALTQTLVNELSAAARQDTLRFAQRDVELMEQRLKDALGAIRVFRESEHSVDPSASAALDIELLANLEARLIDINARIAAQRETLDANAPSVVSLRRNAEALEKQIAERRATIGGEFLKSDGNSSAVTEQLARYESLDVERSLAEKSYASALSSLEQARREADRQQRYLAVFLRPAPPEEAEYPKRLRNTLIAVFACFAAWGIGTLFAYSIRDHLT